MMIRASFPEYCDLKNYVFIDFILTVLTKIHLKILSFGKTLVEKSEFCSFFAHPLPLYTLQSKTCLRKASFAATKVSIEVRTVCRSTGNTYDEDRYANYFFNRHFHFTHI